MLLKALDRNWKGSNPLPIRVAGGDAFTWLNVSSVWYVVKGQSSASEAESKSCFLQGEVKWLLAGKEEQKVCGKWY